MASRSGAIATKVAPRSTAGSTSRPAVRPRTSPGALLTLSSVVLVALGLVMILSASSITAFADYGSSFTFFRRQLLWAIVAFAAYFACVRVDYHRWRGLSVVLYVLSAGLLVVALVPGVGLNVGGSARWIGVGPLSFQPSEIAKLALVLVVAGVLDRKDEKSLRELGHTALPVLPGLGLLAFLVMMQPDLGTAIVLCVIAFGLLFVAGAPLRHLVPLGVAGTGLAVVAALAEDYRRARILAFLNPWADPLNTGYQTIQSLIALGSGGIFGVGLGASRQKWSYIPNSHTDFIFAILGEELGLLGTFMVLGMFVFIAYLGIRIAKRAPDRFGMLVASGITIWIAFQALVNMGAVTAAMPITGVPLPLVSFGGTSLLVTLAALGILNNIAAQERKPRAAAKKRKDEER
ncbi:MAG: putative lipid II flippase FtsW [Actinobacteria bacterium]|nr:putative lipid II flippase FtsW [Actinomycetota bacterium]